MSSLSYPGVYTEERAGAPAPVQGVAASTLALVGWTPRGPVNDPINGLVTGFAEFKRKFGDFNADGLVPTMLHAFFANGGQIARIVRVAPSDAVEAVAYVSEPVVDESVGTGDSTETVFSVTLANTPLEPGTVVVTAAAVTLTDNGSGAFTGAGGTGTIDYTTGEVTVTFGTAPAGAVAIEASYSYVLWKFTMAWPGVVGNDFDVKVFGTPGNENDAAATFDRWTVQVLDNGVVVEEYAGLVVDDATSPDYLPLVINDSRNGSLNIVVTDYNALAVPSSLSGIEYTNQNSGEVPNSTNKQFDWTLTAASCHPTTLTITATAADDSTMTVTDDGFGNLVGDVLATGVNTINYTTGAIDVTFDLAPKTSTTIVSSYFSAPAADEVSESMTGGSDGSALTSSDIIGAGLVAGKEGLFALNKTDDMLMVIVPDFAGNEVVDAAVLDYCESRKDRFAILTTPADTTYDRAVIHKRRTLNRNNNSFGAIYWPWVTITDPVSGRPLNVPPLGHVAGVYARTDTRKNIGKAPAGAVDGSLSFIVGLEASATKSEVGILNRSHVNAIVDWPEVGNPAVWGARTLQMNGEFGYIQARRLMMFVQKSVNDALYSYVFENNGPPLWALIKMRLNAFLGRLYNAGYFAGNDPGEAYFVVVDSTNNPQASIDAGELYVDVGIAPNSPAEFIVARHQRIAGG